MKMAEVRRIALAFPEAVEAPHFDYASFRVRGKIFATAPPGGEFLHVFVDDVAREEALALHGDWIEKLWWGKKVVGLRIALAGAKPAEVRRLLDNAWRRKAPRALVAQSA